MTKFKATTLCFIALKIFLTLLGRLNWWTEIGACRKLFPMSTVGDGNCLLHAVSLGMWGFHDRMLTLRKALYTTLQHPFAKKGLKRRWKYDLWKENMNSGIYERLFLNSVSIGFKPCLTGLKASTTIFFLENNIHECHILKIVLRKRINSFGSG